MKKIIIAIDGYSSTGKSTLARALAKKLSYIFVDTGALYRALSFFALQKNLFDKEPWESKKFIDFLDNISLEFRLNEAKEAKIFLNHKPLEEELRTPEVSSKVSLIAALPKAREKLLGLQRSFGLDKGVVMDGRDIGSVIFPKAELKLFFNASLEIRAKRRHKELLLKRKSITYKEVLENLSCRDQIDSTREVAPLSKTPDAIEIDTTNLTIEENLDKIYKLALERIGLGS